MTEPNDNQETPSLKKAEADLTEAYGRSKQSATEVIHDARDAVKEKATEYLSEATEALGEKAEGVQQDISSQLSALAGAMRAASEHLANNSQREGSKFVLNAATGIERLSSSLKSKPFSDVVGDIRSFGHDNSAALIAGSVLAGLALGRFLKSSAPQEPNADDLRPTTPLSEASDYSEFQGGVEQ